MQWLDIALAVSPLLLLLILMLGLRWKSAHAGAASWVLALSVAALHFGAGSGVLFWAQIRGIFLAFYVLYIIWGALFFYRTTEATGTIAAMGELVQRISPNRALQVLLLAGGLASFLQGVGGFGVPVAVVAPLLAGMGFPLVEAVVLPSLGHAWAVSFGSLGSSFIALVVSTDIAGAALAPWTAFLLGLSCYLMSGGMLWVAGGKAALRQAWLPMLLMATAMAGIQYLAAAAGLWTIAAMLGALGGLLVGGGWALLNKSTDQDREPLKPMLRIALPPYTLLLLLIFATNFIPQLQDLLDVVQLQLAVPEISTARGWTIPAGPTRGISLFGHTGALLIYASALIFGLARVRGKLQAGAGQEILRKVIPSGLSSTLGILTMVSLATTMDHAGMITLLAESMADAAGDFFPLISPFIGALGAFVTGSNTNSNVLFGALQRDVALTLHVSAPLILAAQDVGGALGSTFAPAKILVGCSTVGLERGEGRVIRHLLRYDIPALALIAVVTFALTLLR